MDINTKISMNKGLVYKQLHAFQLLYDQDAESYAFEALHKAVLTFNESAGTAFSTYAVCVINNALRKHLRTLSRKRQLDVVSYYTPVAQGDKELLLLDTLMQRESAEDYVVGDERYNSILAVVHEEYELLSNTHRKILRAFYSNASLNQQDIAKAAGVTQATVSKVISAFRHRIRVRLEELKND